jgi:hypothetical protein
VPVATLNKSSIEASQQTGGAVDASSAAPEGLLIKMKVYLPMLMLGRDDDDDKEDESSKNLMRLILLLHSNHWENETFLSKLNAEGRRRRDRHLGRDALLDLEQAPWNRLYHQGTDKDFITFTGFDRSAFQSILTDFAPLFHSYTLYTDKKASGTCYKAIPLKRRGRKRLVTAHACLGLTLSWYRVRGGDFILQGWFGFMSTHLNIWLRFGRRILFKVLHNNDDARVCFPTDEELKILGSIVSSWHKNLKNVYCTMDGLKLKFQACEDLTEESMYYNGWMHGHYITNLLVFSACG